MTIDIQPLYSKDSSEAYRALKDFEDLSDKSSQLYEHLDEFIHMLSSDRYMVRVRGFRLICRQAPWDQENRIDQSINVILDFLDDEKPTAVRMGLAALHYMIDYKPELHAAIADKITSLDPYRYKDSMSPLIIKDVQNLLDVIAEAE